MKYIRLPDAAYLHWTRIIRGFYDYNGWLLLERTKGSPPLYRYSYYNTYLDSSVVPRGTSWSPKELLGETLAAQLAILDSAATTTKWRIRS